MTPVVFGCKIFHADSFSARQKSHQDCMNPMSTSIHGTDNNHAKLTNSKSEFTEHLHISCYIYFTACD